MVMSMKEEHEDTGKRFTCQDRLQGSGLMCGKQTREVFSSPRSYDGKRSMNWPGGKGREPGFHLATGQVSLWSDHRQLRKEVRTVLLQHTVTGSCEVQQR